MTPHCILLILAGTLLAGQPGRSADFAEPELPVRRLWDIGKADNNTREFALAPGRYNEFREDGFFVVGRSDPARDWPYVHPGPADGWAGGRAHTFTILFGIRQQPTAGDCIFRADLVDTHRQAPPELRVALNGRTLKFRIPAGAGDESVFGHPEQGREHKFEFMFPAEALKRGANEISITTATGSWVLYDGLGLDAPAGVELADVSGTLVSGLESPPMLAERGGQLQQVVQVGLRHFGENTRATVLLEGLGATNLELRAGATACEIAVPAVDRETPVAVTVEVAGKMLAERTLTLKPVRKWVVYLLPHSHVDIGYTHVQTDVEQAQWRYLEMAMDTARKTAGNPAGSRFKWNVEVLWAVDSYLQQATPEKREAFLQAVRAGQVGLDALYGNMLTGLCSQEELLRLLSCGLQLQQQTGVPIESAMITDVPGYTWGMVPAFAHAGVRYFSIGPNGGDRIGTTIKAWGDKPFWWVGPNGRDRVLTWMTGTGYYRVFSSPKSLIDYLGRLNEQKYPYDFVQVRHCLGDNGAPDVNFADTVKAWNDKYAYPKLVIATTAEMFRDFERRYADQLPTARGDFTPYWEDGAGSSARETAMNRASADRLVQAETLFALANSRAYPAAEFYQAWRNVLLYDEHTWGAHNSISQPDHAFVKSQWAIKQSFALDADRQSRGLLAAAHASRGVPVPPPATNVNVIDVFNTTAFGYPYSLVTIPRELSPAGDAIRIQAADPVALVSQRLTTGELVFRPCVAGWEAQRYCITAGTPSPLENEGATADGNRLAIAPSSVGPGITVILDEQTGAIASLKSGGREYVDSKAATAVNDYWYLPGSDLKGLQRNGPVKISVKERGPLVASLLVESDAPGCRKLTREVRVHAFRHYVEIINTVDKLPVRAKEGVHFGFGFNVPGAVVRIDVPWGVVRPGEDQLPGACRNWFTVQRWVDVSNKDYGLTWVTPDAPLVQVGRITANLIGGLSGSPLWLEQIESSPTLYSWAMNNHWHTNYRSDQDGPTVFRFFLFPHARGFSPEEAAARSAECTQSLLVCPARGSVPVAPLAVAGSHGSVQVTAFKPSTDGRARILRLFNLADRADDARLTWAKPAPKSVWLSDASERAGTRIDGPVAVPAHSIVTLRAEWD